MTGEAVLAGSARAVSSAIETCDLWAPSGLELVGAVLIGEGQSSLPTLRRIANWEAASFDGLKSRTLVLASPPEHGAEARAILERAADAHMKVVVIESDALRQLRLNDLIGRPLRDMDETPVERMLAGKRVLVTGAGGSIGAELSRRIAGFGPAHLTLLDSSEFNLFRIALELRSATTVLADIRDAASVRRWFTRERPDIVFHAAALKQVPLVEAFPGEGVLTNIGGVRHVAEAAHAAGADLIFVSTDKAVEPSGAMGATKRLGELYCMALDRAAARRAVPVRLGNVLGSAGSVTPTFEAQLAKGGPLTVTDPEVTRFFLSIPQAAEALLQAGAAALSSTVRGVAMVIDMGEALPVVELAREVIRLEGLRPDIDVPIVFTGLRPGEKLHELLVGADEWVEADLAAGVNAAGVNAVASQPRGLAELHEIMERLCMLARQGADEAVSKALFEALGPAPVATQAGRALVG